MNTAQRTAEELTRGEKLQKELLSEGREVHKSGIFPEDMLKKIDEMEAGDYEKWKTGDASDENSFNAVYEQWVQQGMPTPALDHENAGTES